MAKLLKLGRTGKHALVDDDFEMPPGSLVLSSHGYPKIMESTGVRRPSGSYIYKETYLHAAVLGGVPKGLEVDHISGDKLDARKSNLRICSRGQNCWNTRKKKGRFKGVHRSFNSKKRPWVAQITVHRKMRHLGCFETEEAAAAAYNQAATALYGEYARLNQV